MNIQTFRQLYYCGITKAKSRNSEKETTWKFLLRVDKIRRKWKLKTKNMELIFQVKWKQLKQVEAAKHLRVYMKPLNSPTPFNTSWIETSFQTAAWNLKSKHRVVVVPQLNIKSSAIVKVPTSMNLLYVKCWSESNVVRKLTQHTVYRSKLQNMFFSDNADASVLVLQLHFSFAGRKLLLVLLLEKKLIEKFEKKSLQKDLWRTIVQFLVKTVESSTGEENGDDNDWANQKNNYMKLKFQTFRQLYYCGIKAKSRNSEKGTTWKFLLRVDKIRRKWKLKTKNMELIFQVKWKQLKQVEASKHLRVYMKPLKSPTPFNTSWIETSFQTAAWNLKFKHRVSVVPQLNIKSSAIVKVPTSMNLLYVKCWIESNVVRKLTQHTVYRSKLQNMFCSEDTDASVLVLQLHFSFSGRKLRLETKLLLLTKKLIEKFEKKCLQKDLWRTFVHFLVKTKGNSTGEENGDDNNWANQKNN